MHQRRNEALGGRAFLWSYRGAAVGATASLWSSNNRATAMGLLNTKRAAWPNNRAAMGLLNTKRAAWPKLSGAMAAASLLLLLLLVAAMTLLHQLSISQTSIPEDEEYERRVGRWVRTLQSVQDTRQTGQRARYPWLLPANLTLPSPHLYPAAATPAWARAGGNVTMVFVHQHRSGGTAVERCLLQYGSHGSHGSPPGTDPEGPGSVMSGVDSNSRHVWDTDTPPSPSLPSPQQHTPRPLPSIVSGKFTMGMCGGGRGHPGGGQGHPGGRPCSYFTMFRDPMEREVSSYLYCKTAQGDELCKVLNANAVSLRDWVLHHGSLTLLQLVYRDDWCAALPPDLDVSRVGDLVGGGEGVTDMEPGQWPCWLKQKLWWETLAVSDQHQLVDHVVDQLDKWFSVIGLVSEFENSMQLFQSTYRDVFPFQQCLSGRRPTSPTDSRSNSVHRTRAAQRTRVVDNNVHVHDRYHELVGGQDDNDPEYLKSDYFVQKALEADYRIYKKATQIYHVQKQNLFNSLV